MKGKMCIQAFRIIFQRTSATADFVQKSLTQVHVGIVGLWSSSSSLIM